jgi:hypothetical protein
MFTRALHWSLSCAISIQSTPSHPISLKSILMWLTHLLLGLPSGSFLLAFPPIFYKHLKDLWACFSHKRSEKKENKGRNKHSFEEKKYCEVYKGPETRMVGTFGKNA